MLFLYVKRFYLNIFYQVASSKICEKAANLLNITGLLITRVGNQRNGLVPIRNSSFIISPWSNNEQNNKGAPNTKQRKEHELLIENT
jgi:hypothetical protein